MFEVIEKKTGKRLTVYGVDGDTFLVGVKDGFKLRSAYDFSPIEQKDSAAPVETAPCVFTTAWKDTVDLDALLGGIASGEIAVKLGDMLSTRLLDGTEVDFVVTDQDDKTVRLESRDCLGVSTSARELDSYLRKVYDLLPDALKKCIVETERVHLDSKGKKFTERSKLFLPAQSEIFPSDECYGDEGVYQQMDWYKDVHNRVRADRKGGDSCWYWTSSPRAGNTANWCYVSSYGKANANSASATYIAAPVCFRIPRI